MTRFSLHTRSAAAVAAGLMACAVLSSSAPSVAQDPLPLGDHWIYEDIDAGYAQAAETGKPLLVVFR